MEGTSVTPREPVEEALHTPFETTGGARRAQNHAAEHGRQGEGHHPGDQHRPGQGECEFGEQGADQSAHETDGGIDGYQRGGHGDDGHGQLARPFDRCIESSLALFDVAVDVLDHHDGVVHHQPDGEHHGKQGEQVDGKAHQQHQEGRADQRQGHSHGGHQGGAEGSQAEEDHHQHDQHRLGQGLEHLIDRVANEDAGVVGDVHLEPFGQLGAEIRQQVLHPPGHRQRVLPRGLLDADEDGRDALVEGGGLVVLRAQLHLRDVAQAHQGAVGDHHQVAEVLYLAHVSGRGQIDGEVTILELTDARKIVVAAQDVLDVGGGHSQRGHALRVKPNPHGEGLVADELGLGHARHRLELGLNHAQQVVGDLRQAHGLAVEGHVHERGGIAGGRVDHRVLRLGRQHVALACHLGLDLRDRSLRVVVQLHVCLDGRDPLDAGGEQIVDAVGLGDRLLQRRGDEALDQAAAGAGVTGGDRHHRVPGLRVLAHLEAGDGAQADDQDQQADHARQHRAADEDVGEGHGPSGPFALGTSELSMVTACSLRSLT